MFLGKKQPPENLPGYPDGYESPRKLSNNIVFFGVIVFLFLVVLGIVYLLFLKPKDNKNDPAGAQPVNTASKATGTTPRLPKDIGNGDQDEYDISSTTNNMKIEELTFGYFYEEPQSDHSTAIESYELPVNIKVDADNYYDLSRKLNIDEYVDYINQYGFAIFENQRKEGGNNFFSTYRGILRDNLPIVVTSDFIYYYYQNELKLVFQEIEKNTFFENIWNINKSLYDISLTRYKKRLAEVGLSNDPVLEGERLELVYFAVALKLLMPVRGQINKNANFIDEAKFSEQETEAYSFVLPDYIVDDVEKEVNLIRNSGAVTKSPVFLYERDYSYFHVPSDYSHNAKLNNFYLTLKWLNSVFPLYYQDEDCPKCLLDYNDWLINFAAASFVAKDIFYNEEIKDQWAIIYKFISFFSGLRADLTYLHYNEALTELYGEDYSVEDIFSDNNENREENVIELRDRILQNDFLPLEGAMKGYYPDPEPVLGLRILQEPYWPNDFLFRELSGRDMELYDIDETQAKKDRMITACKMGKSTYYRCTGYSLDVIDLIYPIELSSEEYYLNTFYNNFDSRMARITDSLNKFDVHTWNSNVYWMTLDISRKFFDYNRNIGPALNRSEEWQKRKELNSVLGSWVYLHLPEDDLVNYFEKNNVQRLGAVNTCNKFNYIEPNLELVNELVARNDMLIKMLTVLKVVGNTNTASIQLKELNTNLKEIIDLIKKQTENEEMNDEECRFLTEFVSKYAIEGKSSNSFSVRVENKRIEEKIEGVKMVLLYYKKHDKNLLGVGPIYDFVEKGAQSK